MREGNGDCELRTEGGRERGPRRGAVREALFGELVMVMWTVKEDAAGRKGIGSWGLGIGD